MQLFTPKDSAVFRHDGVNVRWVRGRTLIEEGHPILKGRENMVDPVTVHFPVTMPPEPAPAPEPAPEPTVFDRIDAVTTHAEANELAKELDVGTFEEKKPPIADKKAVLTAKAHELENDDDAGDDDQAEE